MNRMSLLFVWITLAGLSEMAQAAELRVVGSNTMRADVFGEHAAELATETGLTLIINTDDGYKGGLASIRNGNADICMITKSLSVPATTIFGKSSDDLQEHSVGSITVVFITPRDNTVTKLSVAQLKEILSGHIANWSQVGGQDMPITVIATAGRDDLRAHFEKKVAGGPINYGLKTHYIPVAASDEQGARAVLNEVSRTPGSLGITTADLADATVNVLEMSPPLVISLTYVTKGSPSQEAQALINATRKLGLK